MSTSTLSLPKIKNAKRTNQRSIPHAWPVARVMVWLHSYAKLSAQFAGTVFDKSKKIELLAGAVKRDPKASDYQATLYSVGNPDFRQYYGPGVESPICIVSGEKLTDIVDATTAFISIFELGCGNLPSVRVFLRGVEVANVSYNGCCWTPGEWHEAKRIDPATGEVMEGGK